MRKIILTQLISGMLLFGCTSKKMQHSGTFQEKKYTIINVTNDYLTNEAYSQDLQIEGMPVLHIDDINVSKGYPYSFDIFKSTSYEILDSTSISYQNEYDSQARNYAVLYIDPARFSEADFKFFASFFKEEWPKIKDSILLEHGYRRLQPVAIVYGNDAQFSHSFKNPENQHSIEVWTDGEVHYDIGDGVQSANMSFKVQMPGNRIFITKPYTLLNSENITQYKDSNGKTLGDFFELVYPE